MAIMIAIHHQNDASDFFLKKRLSALWVRDYGRVRALVFGNHGEASQDVHHFISAAARKLASDTWDRLGARSEDEAYSCHVQRFRRDVGIAVAREFARYRLLRVPFVGVPRAVIRDRHAGRREARAVPAQGPMQADFFRHQAGIWQAR